MEKKRHMAKKCKLPPPPPKTPKEKSFKEIENGRFQCTKCTQTFAYEAGAYKHVNQKRCKGGGYKEPAVKYKCATCNLEFAYASRLKAHKKRHNRTPNPCTTCFKTFKRSDYYDKHVAKCNDSMTETDPSFVSVYTDAFQGQ